MSLRLLFLVVVQTVLLSGGQVLLKLAMEKMPAFAWSWSYFRALLVNYWFAACGLAFGAATVLWLYILKHFPFSQAYPLTTLGYVFGMIAAMLVFGEQVPAARWIGVVLIMAGCVFIVK